ncbi:MAG: hypothetical protein AELANPGJ_03393 [Anaerolineae bacterium]|nr:hypothetical protein [Anaerolineae bacterium]
MPVSEPIDWSAVKDEMRAILIYLAKQRKTICYSDLAALISTARLHHRAPIFHRLLDEMSREDAAEGMPSLATLVVRKDSGIPGQGYFVISAAEGDTVNDPEAYWQARFDELCDYWATS